MYRVFVENDCVVMMAPASQPTPTGVRSKKKKTNYIFVIFIFAHTYWSRRRIWKNGYWCKVCGGGVFCDVFSVALFTNCWHIAIIHIVDYITQTQAMCEFFSFSFFCISYLWSLYWIGRWWWPCQNFRISCCAFSWFLFCYPPLSIFEPSSSSSLYFSIVSGYMFIQS